MLAGESVENLVALSADEKADLMVAMLVDWMASSRAG
jgi:hypothetical protein